MVKSIPIQPVSKPRFWYFCVNDLSWPLQPVLVLNGLLSPARVLKWLLVILGAILLLAASAEAITKRTHKECLLCHVRWFDAFNTDQETLLEERDSPIVIAGAMGLASSREMCITCHDGYIYDSRANIAKSNPHHAFKKPPAWLDLPKQFRLNSDNEIYCGTCHTLHDIRGTGEVGSTPFMRMDNERSQMCIACHGNKTAWKGYSKHPELMKDIFPRAEAVKKGAQFGPDNEIICQSCHNSHGAGAMIPLFPGNAFFHRAH